uniref:Uncharacterized protein n=1 Tax=viral metagenome TaxID=1070528 RepID=A0A6C0AEE3_9ZZZZ
MKNIKLKIKCKNLLKITFLITYSTNFLKIFLHLIYNIKFLGQKI